MNRLKKRKTKVIWSFDTNQLSLELAKKITEWDITGLRIKYSSEELNDILSFTKKLHSLAEAKGAHIPLILDVNLSQESLKKDLSHELSQINKIDGDFIIISGLKTEKDIVFVKEKLFLSKKTHPWYLIKIDSKEIHEQLGALIEHADGILLSRKDLSLSYNPASIPMVCKEIIKFCNEKSKITFIESDMLSSMRGSPTPTRAEVSDVANAVIDGTDAIIISEEVNLGHHAERAISICNSIIDDLEDKSPVHINWQKGNVPIHTEFDAVAFHSIKTAERIGAKAIVCITTEGNTAKRLASFRVQLPIIAVTFQTDVYNRLLLVRGVQPLKLDINPELDKVLPTVNDKLINSHWLSKGDKIVFVSVSLSPIGKRLSNLFTVQTL